jgi:heptosyltransferase I
MSLTDKLNILPKNPNILVVLMGSLGDVVRGLALVNILKSHFQECTINWIVEPKCEGLVRLHKGIDRILVFPRGLGLGALVKFIKELRDVRCDLTLDLQRHLKSGIITLLAASPIRIGFNPRDSKEFNWIFQTNYIPQKGDQIQKLSHYLAFADLLGAKQQELNFGIKWLIHEKSHEHLFSKISPNYIGLVLGSSWDSKDWPLDEYKKLIGNLLSTKSLDIVLLGDKSQVANSESLFSYCNDSRVHNLTGKTSLPELIALIGRSNLCIGPDSGPGHIAGALGVKYIGLYGPTSELRTAPYGSESDVISANLGCRPCYKRRCPGLDKLCMRLISADMVVNRLETVLAYKNKF